MLPIGYYNNSSRLRATTCEFTNEQAIIFIYIVPVAQVHSNIKKYLQDWDKNINFMECKARKNIRRNYSQVFS